MDRSQRFLRNAKCFECTIKRFNQTINEGAVERTIGTVGDYQWRAKIEKFVEEDVDYLSIQAGLLRTDCYFRESHKKFSMEMAICVKNKSPKRWVKGQGRFEVERREWNGWNQFMRMDTILGPRSGFLRGGALVIQFEIRVDFFIGHNENRILNIFDPFEGSVKTHFLYCSRPLYMCPQILILHSPLLAELLADGRDEVFLPDFAYNNSVYMFFQLIHAIKITFPTDDILQVLYLAHKYHVLTVLRQMEVQIKNYSDKEIHKVHIDYPSKWMKTMIGDEYSDEELRRMVVVRDKSYEEEYKELTDRKREMLVAITRAPFTHDFDSDSSCIVSFSRTEPEPRYRSRRFSIFRFISKIINRMKRR